METKQNKSPKVQAIILSALSILISINILAENAFAEKKLKLFYVENSIITSKAVYAIKLNNNYQINQKSPIFNYWLRPGGSTRNMTWFENYIAYGILYQKVKNKYTIELALSKYPEIKIIAHIQNNKAISYFIFKNKKYILEKLYAKAHEGIFVPSVDYVEVIGYDIKSKEKIVKRIQENKDDSYY